MYYSIVETLRYLKSKRTHLMGKQIDLVLSSHGSFYYCQGNTVSSISFVYRR